MKQLDNDVQAIYVMLADIQATQKRHENRFHTIDGRLDGIDGRLDGMGDQLAEILRRLPG